MSSVCAMRTKSRITNIGLEKQFKKQRRPLRMEFFKHSSAGFWSRQVIGSRLKLNCALIRTGSLYLICLLLCRALNNPYPTKPTELVMEVLSPTDAMSLVHDKCQNYQRIGIQQIFVLGPECR